MNKFLSYRFPHHFGVRTILVGEGLAPPGIARKLNLRLAVTDMLQICRTPPARVILSEGQGPSRTFSAEIPNVATLVRSSFHSDFDLAQNDTAEKVPSGATVESRAVDRCFFSGAPRRSPTENG